MGRHMDAHSVAVTYGLSALGPLVPPGKRICIQKSRVRFVDAEASTEEEAVEDEQEEESEPEEGEVEESEEEESEEEESSELSTEDASTPPSVNAASSPPRLPRKSTDARRRIPPTSPLMQRCQDCKEVHGGGENCTYTSIRVLKDDRHIRISGPRVYVENSVPTVTEDGGIRMVPFLGLSMASIMPRDVESFCPDVAAVIQLSTFVTVQDTLVITECVYKLLSPTQNVTICVCQSAGAPVHYCCN